MATVELAAAYTAVGATTAAVTRPVKIHAPVDMCGRLIFPSSDGGPRRAGRVNAAIVAPDFPLEQRLMPGRRGGFDGCLYRQVRHRRYAGRAGALQLPTRDGRDLPAHRDHDGWEAKEERQRAGRPDIG